MMINGASTTTANSKVVPYTMIGQANSFLEVNTEQAVREAHNTRDPLLHSGIIGRHYT